MKTMTVLARVQPYLRLDYYIDNIELIDKEMDREETEDAIKRALAFTKFSPHDAGDTYEITVTVDHDGAYTASYEYYV